MIQWAIKKFNLKQGAIKLSDNMATNHFCSSKMKKQMGESMLIFSSVLVTGDKQGRLSSGSRKSLNCFSNYSLRDSKFCTLAKFLPLPEVTSEIRQLCF